MRSIVNKIRLFVRKYLMYLVNSDKEKKWERRNLRARGGGGGQGEGLSCACIYFLTLPTAGHNRKSSLYQMFVWLGYMNIRSPLEVCHRVFANPVLCERKNVYAS